MSQVSCLRRRLKPAMPETEKREGSPAFSPGSVKGRGGKRPGAGRPGIGGALPVRLDRPLRERLSAYATVEGVSLAAAARRTSEAGVAEWEREQQCEAWLVSHLPGDDLSGVEGADIALVDHLGMFGREDVQEWMREQGFGADDPDECMFLALESPEGGRLPVLRVELSPVDAARFAAVRTTLARERAADSS